jgi:hypothetical protein
MAKHAHVAQEFLVNVGNLVKDGTDLKRKVLVRFLDTNWEARYVRISAKVVFFSKATGDVYGSEIKSLGRPEIQITAANQWVNAATGALLVNPDGSFMSESQIPADVTYMTEFDFFDMIAGTPQTVKEQITTYVNTAFASGKYDV